MAHLQNLLERIIDRVNINLRAQSFDVRPYVQGLSSIPQGTDSFACYALSTQYPLHFYFRNSCLTGSYFLGKCQVRHGVVIHSDIRGDELKRLGQEWEYEGIRIPLHKDEEIRIRDSILDTTLVHSCSHDPENPDEFIIRNTVAMPCSKIHGSPVAGSFLGAFATVDSTTVSNCVIGPFAYIMTDDVYGLNVPAGTVWLRNNDWEFKYTFDQDELATYIRQEPGKEPEGEFMVFTLPYDRAFRDLFSKGGLRELPETGQNSFVSRYCVIKGECHIADNVLVSQRACLENATLGTGTNAQEKCYIVNSELGKYCVTAHGGKIANATLGDKVFTGFSSYMRGRKNARLNIGCGCIIMPHTIIDVTEPLDIPRNHLVWGLIRSQEDLENHSIDLEELASMHVTKAPVQIGRMRMTGNPSEFVNAFYNRVQHILEENGAFFDGEDRKGHSQQSHSITFNIIQPYSEGHYEGMYPTIEISR